MQNVIFQLIGSYGGFCLAVISPGPDFAITLQNSIRYGKRAGLQTAAGIAVANAGHILVISLGVGAIVANSVLLHDTLIIGASLFLSYMGIKSIAASLRSSVETPSDSLPSDATRNNPFQQGLLVNILNIKAILFWISYFTLVFKTHYPAWIKIPFSLFLIISIFIWFSVVASVMSNSKIRFLFFRYEKKFNFIMGLILIGLAGAVFSDLM